MTRPLGKNRDFIAFLISRLLATISIQMQFVAVGWQVYDMTNRPLDLGLIGLVQFLPIASLSLFGGQVADRNDRRKIILVCQGVITVCAFLLSFYSGRGSLDIRLIYFLLFVIGVTRAFWGPAVQSFLPRLVTREELPKAVAWNSSTWQIAVIVGPSIGGLIYGVTNRAAAVYLVSGVLMTIAVLFTLLVRTRTGRTDPTPISLQTFLAGVRYVWKEKILLGAMSLDLFAVLLGGAVALLPAYARDILHIGPGGLGLLRSAPSIGAAAMGVLLAFRPMNRNIGPRLFFCVTAFGLLTILFGVSTNFILSLVALIAMGAFDLVSVVTRQSLIQLRTPDVMRGRVSAVNFIFVGASNELGEFESGVTAWWFGLVPAVVIGGVGTCVVAGLWAWFFPGLRRLHRFVDETEISPRAPSRT